MKNKNTFIKSMVLISYLLMIVVNALANILPINNLTTGEVSDSFPNLFAPTGLTFSIWGVIYLLLGIYSFYQLFSKKINSKLSNQINTLFIISSFVNSAWIFAWHYKLIWLTVLLMLVLLASLIKIANIFNKEKLNFTEKLICKIPFGIYFGWITIATIANITGFLVSIGWNAFGLSETFWMILILLIGVMIASWRMFKDSNLAYGLVPVWAYYGIWLKHTMSTGFNNSYPTIIMTVIICIVLLIISNITLIARKKAI
ncbi:MAG: tryptophan-rich sensory protein [Candidatus Gracilibacteria bacterium]|nr:tryptophan-rich sensory protein [Candidatus Gracilibacteria bacterium]